MCTASGGRGNGARREVGEDDDGTNGTVCFNGTNGTNAPSSRSSCSSPPSASLSPDGMRAMELPDEDSDEERRAPFVKSAAAEPHMLLGLRFRGGGRRRLLEW